MPIDPALRGFRRDERGHVAVAVSLMMTVLMGFAALGVDAAALYRQRAELQSLADLTAMSAMGDAFAADSRAAGALAGNGRGAAALSGVTTGRYLRNPALAPEARFTALPQDNPLVNAVQVALAEPAPLHFARVFMDNDSVALNAAATASRTGAASFSLTSHIARLDGATLNEALTEALSIQVALSAGEMQMLASAEVNLHALLDALAVRIGDTERNPAEILDRSVTMQDLLLALQEVVASDAATVLAPLTAVDAALSMRVEALAGGIDSALGITAREFAGEIAVSALDVLKAVAMVRLRAHEVILDAAIPSVTSVGATLRLAEPPARSGWIALGEEGAQLHRAAAHLQADVELAPDLLGNLGAGITATRLSLPLVVEVAGATATLDEIACHGTGTDIAARFLTAQRQLHPLNGTAIAALYLGHLPDAAAYGAPLDPAGLGFAQLLELDLVIALPLLPDIEIGGLVVQARSHVALGQSRTESIAFSHDDIAAGRTTGHFGSGEVLGTAVQGLLSPENTELRLQLADDSPLPAAAVPVVQSLMTLLPQRLLTALAGPVDSVLDATLDEAGLGLGVGELTLTGHHCELIRLVR